MALGFPRDMPSVGARQQSFEPARVDYLSPETGGRIGAVTAGWPLWTMTLTLAAMLFEDSDQWRAWLARQRGPQQLFVARDLDRPMPKRHMGGRPFNKVASSWSQTIDADGTAYLTLDGQLPGTVLAHGDYVDFRWSTYSRSLVRAIDIGAANGSGVLTVPVEPPVPAITPGGAVAHLDSPGCLMRIMTSGTTLADQDIGFTQAGGKIAAVQELVA